MAIAVGNHRTTGPDGFPAGGGHRRITTESAVRFRFSRFEIIERDAILDALERHRGAVAEAAEDLGFSRATMYRKVKRYGIRPARQIAPESH